MRSIPRRTSGLIRLTAAAVTALHLAAWGLRPVVHASGEVWQSQPEIESKHTAQCPRIHSDRICLSSTTYQFPSGPARDLLDHSLPEIHSSRSLSGERLHSCAGFPGLAARAPPIS